MNKFVENIEKDFGKPLSKTKIKFKRLKDVENFIKNKKESENRKLPNNVMFNQK